MKSSMLNNPFEGFYVSFIEDPQDSENADGLHGHLEIVGKVSHVSTIYEKYVKRILDLFISLCLLIILSPLFLIIAIVIKIEDPGPVFFSQKRIGQNKSFFMLHKFRSMKMNTPRDMPTHQLSNPEQYITKCGRFIRQHSIDELPQLWDIARGKMSIIGPRPALWNQDYLISERDRYYANDIRPGLTGLAQISGRDELEISKKAKLDGEYVKTMGLVTDIKLFLLTLHVFKGDDTIVEGMKKG